MNETNPSVATLLRTQGQGQYGSLQPKGRFSHSHKDGSQSTLQEKCTEPVWVLLLLFVLQEEKVLQAQDQISSAPSAEKSDIIKPIM